MAAEEATDGRPATRADLSSILERTTKDASRLVDGVTGILTLEWKKLRLRAIDGAFRIALLLLLILAGAAAAIAAAVLVVVGACHALARLGGADWIGELGAGLFFVALLFVVGDLARRRVRRRLLAAAVEPGKEST